MSFYHSFVRTPPLAAQVVVHNARSHRIDLYLNDQNTVTGSLTLDLVQLMLLCFHPPLQAHKLTAHVVTLILYFQTKTEKDHGSGSYSFQAQDLLE